MKRIKNSSLSGFEVEILSRIAKNLQSDILVDQINASETEHFISAYYHIVRFSVDQVEILDLAKKSPVELIIYPPDKTPVVVWLHIKDGYIKELEIFNADSTRIEYDILEAPYKMLPSDVAGNTE